MDSSLIPILTLGASVIASLIVAVIYITTQIDKKLSTLDYDREIKEMRDRMRKLELWASKKSFSDH